MPPAFSQASTFTAYKGDNWKFRRLNEDRKDEKNGLGKGKKNGCREN
jgi:hypothetical protein